MKLWVYYNNGNMSYVFSQTSVKVWFHALGKTSGHRKLTFLYLANDVVQNTKKKSPEIAKEFGTVMKKVLEHLSVLVLDEKTVKSIDRLLSIWTERDIFEKSLQDDLNRIWATKKLELEASSDDKEPGTPPPQKKPKKADSPSKKKIRVTVAPSEEKKARKDSTSSNKTPQPLVDDDDDLLNSILSSESPNSDEVEDDGEEGGKPHGDPPDPEELMKALTELENSPSSDAVVREKIAKLPASVSEVGLLDNLKSPDEAQKLLKKVIFEIGFYRK